MASARGKTPVNPTIIRSNKKKLSEVKFPYYWHLLGTDIPYITALNRSPTSNVWGNRLGNWTAGSWRWNLPRRSPARVKLGELSRHEARVEVCRCTLETSFDVAAVLMFRSHSGFRGEV